VFIKHVALQPNLRIQGRADAQGISPQRALIDQDFQLNTL
jgi:hypothetical protein